jgi:hypothetical protein
VLSSPWLRVCIQLNAVAYADEPETEVPACGSANIPDCCFSAVRYALARLSIVAPQRGYDEPAILSYAISSFCPTSADGPQSARAIRVGGMVRPSTLAVFRLITSWYLEARSTGKSAGLVPSEFCRCRSQHAASDPQILRILSRPPAHKSLSGFACA